MYIFYEFLLLGFIKATQSDKPPSLHIGDLGNAAVNEKIATIKKKLLNPLKALQGMKPHGIANGKRT